MISPCAEKNFQTEAIFIMTKTVFATNTSVALNPSPNAFSLVRNPGINYATAYCDVRKRW